MKTTRLAVMLLTLCLSIIMAACGATPATPPSAQGGATAAPAAGAATAAPAGATAAPAGATAAPAAGAAAKPAEPFHISYYVNYDWFTPEPWGQDQTSKWLQENKGIVFDWVSSSGAAAAKLNTMIASGDLPDAMMLDRGADVERLAEAKLIVPLDPYLPNSTLRKKLGDGVINLLRSSDGKLYCFPNWYIAGDRGNGNSGWMINTKIYEELGSPKLETFDDLTAYLRQVKQKYPDVVPLELGAKGTGFSVMMSGFAENFPIWFINLMAYPDGDQLKPLLASPVLKEALTYGSQLFREKLISQDSFTQTRDQYMEKLKNGKAAVVAGVVATEGQEALIDWKKQDPKAGYRVIWPIHKAGLDPQKIKVEGYSKLGWNCNVISAKAKDPAAIFSYLDWVTSDEGQRIAMFGPPGVMWELNQNGDVVPTEASKKMTDDDKKKVIYGMYNLAGDTTYVDTIKTKMQLMLPEDQREFTTMAQYNVTWKTSMPVTWFEGIKPLPNTPEGVAFQSTVDLWSEYVPKVFFAKSDAEVGQLLEEAQKRSADAGFDKALQFMTAKWKKNRELLYAK